MTTTARDLTPALLNDALGPALGGAQVTRVDVEVVGTGQMAECLRLRLA